VRATDDDAALPQLVVPLVVGEVVEPHRATEVDRGNRRRRVLRRGVAGPAGPGERVDKGRDERAGIHGRRVEARGEQATHHRHRVVEVRRRDLHRGRLPDDAALHQLAASGVTRQQEVLLRDLHQPGLPHGSPQSAEAVPVGRRWRLRQHRYAGRNGFGDDRRIGHPRHAADDEVRPAVEQPGQREMRGHAPAPGHLLGRVSPAYDDAGDRESLR